MSSLAVAASTRPASAVLEAAKGLFAERGLQEVTMAEIAAAAGVSRATVFNQFGSKAAVLDAIAAEILEGYVALLQAALADRESSTLELMRRLFEQMGRGIEADAAFYRAVFNEIAKVSLGLDDGSRAHAVRQAAADLLVQLHLRGQARGELTRSQRAEDLAVAFDGLVFGVIARWLHQNFGEPLHVQMGRACEVLIHGVVREAGTQT